MFVCEPSLIVCITEICNLHHHVRMWTIMVVIKKIISFSWKISFLPAPYNFRFDLCWLNRALSFIYFTSNRAFKTLFRGQSSLPHRKLPLPILSVNFNFEQTNLPHDYEKLLLFSKGDFCTCWCAFFNTSKTICSAGWKVSNRVILSSWCFGRFLKRLFLSIKFTCWISGRMISDL